MTTGITMGITIGITIGQTLLDNGYTSDARGWAIDPRGPYTNVEGRWYRSGSQPSVPKVRPLRVLAGMEEAGPVDTDNTGEGQGVRDSL